MAQIDSARFGHVNVTGRDWRRLAAFYTRYGEVVTLTTSDGRHVTWCYATDPEGNLVELQAWS